MKRSMYSLKLSSACSFTFQKLKNSCTKWWGWDSVLLWSKIFLAFSAVLSCPKALTFAFVSWRLLHGDTDSIIFAGRIRLQPNSLYFSLCSRFLCFRFQAQVSRKLHVGYLQAYTRTLFRDGTKCVLRTSVPEVLQPPRTASLTGRLQFIRHGAHNPATMHEFCWQSTAEKKWIFQNR